MARRRSTSARAAARTGGGCPTRRRTFSAWPAAASRIPRCRAPGAWCTRATSTLTSGRRTVSRSMRTRPSDVLRAGSLGGIERLAQLGRGEELGVDRRADVELAGACQAADDDRLEAGVADQPLRDLERRGVVARERDPDQRRLAMRLAREAARVDRVERAPQA